MPDTTTNLKTRNEFNQWAEAGRGEEMEDHHLPIALPVLELMRIGPQDAILDLGCGDDLVQSGRQRQHERQCRELHAADRLFRQCHRWRHVEELYARQHRVRPAERE